MGIDPMADAVGQQSLSPYHAMACNPSTMVDPLGLLPHGEAHGGGSIPQYGNETAMRYPTMPNFLKGLYDYGDYSGNKMLENKELQRLIETNINAYLATVGGQGARYYGGQAQVMFARLQSFRGQSYKVESNGPSGYNPADATEMEGVGTTSDQDSKNLPEVNIKVDISWQGLFQFNSSNAKPKYPLVRTLNDFFGKGSFIVSNALSFADTKAGKFLSMGGAYVFKGSVYSVQKGLLQEASATGAFTKSAGKHLGYAGVAITLTDMVINGPNTSNSIDLAMGIIGFIPGWGWIASGVYFVGNAAIEATTGKNIGQHIDSWIEKK